MPATHIRVPGSSPSCRLLLMCTLGSSSDNWSLDWVPASQPGPTPAPVDTEEWTRGWDFCVFLFFFLPHSVSLLLKIEGKKRIQRLYANKKLNKMKNFKCLFTLFCLKEHHSSEPGSYDTAVRGEEQHQKYPLETCLFLLSLSSKTFSAWEATVIQTERTGRLCRHSPPTLTAPKPCFPLLPHMNVNWCASWQGYMMDLAKDIGPGTHVVPQWCKLSTEMLASHLNAGRSPGCSISNTFPC